MRQKKYFLKFFFITSIFFINYSLISLAEAPHKINGEEVYEPKKDEHKKDEHKNDEHKNDEHKNDEHKKDEPKKDEPKKDEPKKDEPKKDEPKKDEPKKDEPKSEETTNSTSDLMNNYKANKVITSEEDDPYEIHKPVGIFWFFAVFVILLIVIFVFT